MDLPILKYLDILIGLSVAMLLVSTAVMAIAQMCLSTSFARARYLRDGLQELLAQLEPALLGPHKRYLAQRVLRHPLVSRSSTSMGRITGWIRNYFRRMRDIPGLPSASPGNVVQREELIGILLEWAAGEGPLAQQDRELSLDRPAEQALLTRIRESLAQALRNGGIGDPSAVIQKVRQLGLDNERANPQLASAQWRAQAVLDGAASQFTAKVFGWYDNTIQRVSGNFALEARVLSSLAAALVCIVIQFDSFDLVKRLAQDDKFRDAMVARAAGAQKQYEALQQKAAAAPATAPPAAPAPAPPQPDLENARNELNQSLQVLQDPKLAVVPSSLVWDDVWQLLVPQDALTANSKLTFTVGAQTSVIELPSQNPADTFLQKLTSLMLPVSAYRTKDQIRLVARDPAATISLTKSDGTPVAKPFQDWDRAGFGVRFPGIIFSWILVSLGAPFWYDLLKKLLGLRTLLANKDEDERAARQASQQPADAAPPVLATQPTVISGTPDLVKILATTSLRSGRPSESSPEVGKLEADTLISVTGAVEGDVLVDAQKRENKKWFQTPEGYFFWSGVTDKP